ncbi:MAG: glycosyltransferase [Candidatus Hodarchaeota archaeon]
MVDEKLTIAIVTLYPLDPAKTIGGIQAVVQNLVGELKNHVKIHVMTVDFDQDIEYVKEPKVTLHFKTASKGINRFMLFYTERKWIQKKIVEISTDLVHVHGTDMYGYSVLGVNKPVLLTVHGILSKEADIADTDLSFLTRRFNKVKGSFNTYFENKTLKNLKHC